MPTRNLTIVFLAALIGYVCYQKTEHNRYAATIAEVIRLIEGEYVDEVKATELFEKAMDGMVSGLDQYSQFFGPESFKQMEESLDQKFGGVGIVVEKTQDNEPLLVLSPVVGTPAYKAGMRAGDKILEIDGVSTIGMSSADAVKRMRGEPGTTVKLITRHSGDDQPNEIVIIRAEIPVESVLGDTREADGTWDFHLSEDPRIAYLHITTFGKQTSAEIEQVLAQHPYEGVILDLRGNAGGLLSAAIETCDLFISAGRIVSTRGRDGLERDVYSASSSTSVPMKVPVVVLVNGYSASASEIVAACLQDHQRAIVVGQRTWGKGTVQNLFELQSGRCALKITTASYWRPSGKNIHRRKDAKESEDWGVSPSSGYEVVISDEEYGNILKWRQTQFRQKTIPNESSASPAEPATEKEPREQTPVSDPQLKRAVEYLHAILGNPS